MKYNNIKARRFLFFSFFLFCLLGFFFFFFQKQTALKLDFASKTIILEKPYLSEVICTTLQRHSHQNLVDFIDSWKLYDTHSSLCPLADLSITYVFLNYFVRFCFLWVPFCFQLWRPMEVAIKAFQYREFHLKLRKTAVWMLPSLIIFQSQRTYWGLERG